MRIVTMRVKVDVGLCTGCSTCERVCPTLSIRVGEDLIAEVDELTCLGCSNCQDRCPEYAVKLVPLKESQVLEVDWTQLPYKEIVEMCRMAHMNPVEVICFSTGTQGRGLPAAEVRSLATGQLYTGNQALNLGLVDELGGLDTAREVAASILLGADTPEKISRQTGIRTGCGVECIQPILRLLTAAGIKLGEAPGYQWYGLTPTIWDLPEEVVKNPEFKKFYFNEDRKLMDRVMEAKGGQI